MCISMCVCILVSAPHLESCVCQLKEEKGKDWTCRKGRQILAFLNTVEIFIQFLFLALISFNKLTYIMYNQNPVVLSVSPGAK